MSEENKDLNEIADVSEEKDIAQQEVVESAAAESTENGRRPSKPVTVPEGSDKRATGYTVIQPTVAAPVTPTPTQTPTPAAPTPLTPTPVPVMPIQQQQPKKKNKKQSGSGKKATPLKIIIPIVAVFLVVILGTVVYTIASPILFKGSYVKKVFENTGKRIEADLKKVTKTNKIFAEIEKTMGKSYTVEVVPSYYVNPIHFNNDMKSKLMSITTEFYGSEIGAYISNKEIAIDALGTAYAADAKKIKNEIVNFVNDNDLSSYGDEETINELINSIPDDLDVSYDKINSMIAEPSKANLTKTYSKEIKTLKDLATNLVISAKIETKSEDMYLHGKDRKVEVMNLTFDDDTVRKHFSEFADSVSKLENSEIFEQFLLTRSNLSLNDMIDEMFDEIDFEDTVISLYVYKDTIVKVNFAMNNSYSFVDLSISLLGEDIIFEDIEISSASDDFKIALESDFGESIWNVKAKVNLPYERSLYTLKWDFNEKNSNNVVISDGEYEESFFFGVRDGAVEINMNGSYILGSSFSDFKVLFKPLMDTIKWPAKTKPLREFDLFMYF